MILFGTGGIRGKIGDEFNDDVVIRASKALGRYVLGENGPKRVVVAYDTRNRSKEFAELTGTVLSGMGIDVLVFDRETPTPVLSFACRYMNAFGVVITASHNPPEYNGYKVYTPDGVQAVPEVTGVIADSFLKEDADFEVGEYSTVPAEVEEEYTNAVLETVGDPAGRLKVAYTPLHGTGWRFVPRLLRELGLDVVEVGDQMKPDGDFPTVGVPNPEEDEALTMLRDFMKASGADLGLANDPDADRLGVLVRTDGNIVRLTGNQVGVLLTDHLTSGNLPPDPVVIKTVVTTNMVKPMGEDRGFDVEETPTGFKFIGELIEKHERLGDKSFVFGFEESYGYLTGKHVRDKDGILAAALVSVAFSKMNPLERLEELYARYGYHVEKLVSFTFENVEEAKCVYEKLKSGIDILFDGPLGYLDYSMGVGSIRPNETLKVILEEGEIYIRPSGTEPKLKVYLMVVGGSRDEARSKLEKLERVMIDVVSRTRGEG